MVHIDWNSKNGTVPPSAVHGWLTKLRGIFTFNKEYMREREERRRRRRREEDRRSGRKSGFFGSVFGSDYGDGYHRSRHSHHPFLHYPHRCRPWYVL
ncbi:hypothetical protein SCHPADRAFT_136022 [Schizopora paradoxa]|uniref:Uncharacterized protein n=1 Tax=Schizopora paradoxa TaxID=27342 RepID=A0A0H2S234_9AGAM|nr:hypothetical protein SCHPADRAFT_136022 [Schizopora paradoxa]